MIKQNINIVNYQTLYNILEEIKTYLSFNIFNYFDEKEFLKHLEANEIDIKKSLFLAKKKDKFFFKNLKINKNQIFEIPDLPINIYSLIEKINIQLIKQRYNYQSKVFLKNYVLDINSREIIKENKRLKLTEREIDTILFLGKYMDRPLHFFGAMGLFFAVAGIIVECYVLYLKYFLFEPFQKHIALLIFGAILIIAGLQLFTFGLLGELIVNKKQKVQKYIKEIIE